MILYLLKINIKHKFFLKIHIKNNIEYKEIDQDDAVKIIVDELTKQFPLWKSTKQIQ